MPTRDWDLIKSVFEKAREAPEQDQSRLLESLCGGDTGLLAFVQSLIRNDREVSPAEPMCRTRVFADQNLVAGRFRIIRFIDQGAMGEVYEAFDERLHQRVALKTVRAELVRSPDARSRFEREIRMAREVTHENLCRVFDYVEGDGGIPCYTMELIEGESLASLLDRERPLASDAALELVRQIAHGLDALHERGIVHRDLKPSNIMLARHPQLRVVLMDFGLAKLLNPEEELFQTRIEQQMGAPYFMAPELLRDEQPSIASDLYAFGLIVDEMVTRSRAFAAQSLQSLYFAKLWESPIPPGERSDGLPPAWQAAILKCLAGQPSERFASASAFVTALESTAPVVVTAGKGIRLPAWKPRLQSVWAPIAARPVTLSLAGALALAAGLAMTFATSRAEIPVVQVYDVENATGDSTMAYLCKGTSNELIRRMTRLEGVRVVPMHEVRRPGAAAKGGAIAVEGSLLGSGDQLRLTVLLTDLKSGTVFGTENLDAKASESLRVENELALNTTAKLEAHLVSGSGVIGSVLTPALPSFLTSWFRSAGFHPQLQVAAGPTTNGPAFDSYLRGRQLMDEFTRASLEAALPYLNKAVELDPKFALGYATLAEANLSVMTFMQTPQQQMMDAAQRAAGIAIALDPQLPEAQAAQAIVLQVQWDWQKAEEHFRKALSLKPRYPAAKRRYAGMLLQFGRTAEALPLAEQAFAEDPYDRGAIPGMGLYYFLSGRIAESISFLEAQIGESDMQAARHNLGDSLAQAAIAAAPAERARLFRRALAQADRVTLIESKSAGPGGFTPTGDEMHAHYLTMMGDASAAEPYYLKMEAEYQAGVASPSILAWLCALRGDKNRALTLLEEGYAHRDRRMLYVKLFPALASLHAEPRFQAIVAGMKL